MNKVLAFLRNEPALVVAVVVAVLALLAAFGLPVSDEQKAAIVGVVTAILALVGGVVTRSQVTPVAKLEDAGQFLDGHRPPGA